MISLVQIDAFRRTFLGVFLRWTVVAEDVPR